MRKDSYLKLSLVQEENIIDFGRIENKEICFSKQ